MNRTLLVSLIIFLETLVLAAREASAFPEMVRHGYQTCGACHVAGSSGGGALNGYGRPTGREILSTLKGSTLKLPSWVDAGANYRWLNYNLQLPDGTKLHQKFPMASEGELALRPLPGFTIAASVGTYGPLEVQEYRRAYLKLDLGEYVSLKAGKFLPHYGWNDPDHTLSVRKLMQLGQGKEAYAVEGAVTTRWGELALTHAIGEQALIEGSDKEGLKASGEEPKSYARLAAFTSRTTQIGAQARATGKQVDAYGGFAFASYQEWLYAIAEADRTKDDLATYAKIGVEPYRGVHLFLTHEFIAKTHKPGAGLQWFPITGVEALVRVRRELGLQGHSDELSLLLHSYL